MNKATRKYLDRHAESEGGAIRESPLHGMPFGHVLVIPVFSEGENLFETLASIPSGPRGPLLVIVVINGSPHTSDHDHQQNKLTLDRLKNRFPERSELVYHPPLYLHEFPLGKLMVVDRASPHVLFPEKEGVGLARKIGCDIALALHARGQIQSPWIHTTDADVILPADYFEAVETIFDEEASALLYPFHHQYSSDPRVAEAMRLYETHLGYYLAGLKWAGSPYAYHTIGSTLALRASSYAEVGGFPKRMAGEDFYLLNKLAKVGRIHSLSGSPLRIQGRLSQRVPFGTGMGLYKILKGKEEGRDYCLYHPQVFYHLKFWLSFIDELTEKYNKNLNRLWASWIQDAPPFLYIKELVRILEDMEAKETIQDMASQSSDPSTFRRHLNTWFDSFRTLKLIHALRDTVLPSIPWEEALSKAPFIPPFEKGGLGGIFKNETSPF